MNATLTSKESTSTFALQVIQARLDEIGRHMDGENQSKQALIDQQYAEIQQLKKRLGDKNTAMAELRQTLQECRQTAEGHRQLVNKLLNDISQYQNDIEWYKKTYVKRTFLGILKERLLRPRS